MLYWSGKILLPCSRGLSQAAQVKTSESQLGVILPPEFTCPLSNYSFTYSYRLFLMLYGAHREQIKVFFFFP